MPRLTDQQYLKTRTWLVDLWTSGRRHFAELSYTEQGYVHQYFRLSDDLTDSQALYLRGEVSALQPSLPQRAGRALVTFQRLVTGAVEVPGPRSREQQHGRVPVVKGVRRPAAELDDVVKALLKLVRSGRPL